MSEYHEWRENVVYAHAKLSTIMRLLYELSDQFLPITGVMSCSGVHPNIEELECIANAARYTRDLKLRLDNMLDEAERNHKQRRQGAK